MTRSFRETLAANLARVRERIEEAARRAGRRAEEVRLVAVTKYVDVPVIEELYELGLRDFGESRPQSLWEKQPRLAGDVRWHLIGSWQTNKVRRTIPLVELVHSIDRAALAELVSAEAVRAGRKLDVLLEVKLAADESKHGYRPDDLRREFDQLRALPGMEVRGLMTMASLTADEGEIRTTFAQLRSLRDELREHARLEAPWGWLSMGMSHDFEIAIEEGATHVRVGSSLFEGILDD